MKNIYIQWATNSLINAGYKIYKPEHEIIQDTPWSKVFRIRTNKGLVYLKRVPPALYIELNIINILQKNFPVKVPSIIAQNNEQQCFLMKDSGVQLHEHFKTSFNSDVLTHTVADYTSLQIMAQDKVSMFLDLGVPDWRLEALPKLYNDLIAEEHLLISDGLTKDELLKLKKLAPKLQTICEKLSKYEIKDTFGHADYHDKNILINTETNQTTLIDLGEVVITHPFFSLLNCLYRAKENFSLSDSQYQQLQQRCLKPWLVFESNKHLFEIFAIIQQCWSIHSVLGEHRLLNSIDQSAFKTLSREGRLANNLRHWINH